MREHRLCNVRLHGKVSFFAAFGWVFKNELSIVVVCYTPRDYENNFFTITAEILARPLANFYCQ